jgi:hypothetical protein
VLARSPGALFSKPCISNELKPIGEGNQELEKMLV